MGGHKNFNYSGGLNTEYVQNLNGPQLFGPGPNHLKTKQFKMEAKLRLAYTVYKIMYRCYQFRVPRNLRIDIKDRLEEYSQSIEIDIHDCTQTQKSQI